MSTNYQIEHRKRKLQVMLKESVKFLAFEFAVGHAQRSKLFKPEVSVIVGEKDLINNGEYNALFEKCRKEKKDQRIPLHVTSDGRKAYISRV